MAKVGAVLEIDFHHHTVESAIGVVESIINHSRMVNEPVDCRFITGRGKIQREFMAFFKEVYGLEPSIPISNTGVVNVYIY